MKAFLDFQVEIVQTSSSLNGATRKSKSKSWQELKKEKIVEPYRLGVRVRSGRPEGSGNQRVFMPVPLMFSAASQWNV